MDSDFSVLDLILKDFEQLSSSLLQQYTGEWDDPVHDSFKAYNETVKKIDDEVSSKFAEVKGILQQISGDEEILRAAERVIEEVKCV